MKTANKSFNNVVVRSHLCNLSSSENTASPEMPTIPTTVEQRTVADMTTTETTSIVGDLFEDLYVKTTGIQFFIWKII